MRFSACSLAVALAALLSCGQPSGAPAPKAEPPAKVRGGLSESELGTITLTAQAEARLGIRTAAVEIKKVGRTRAFGGEVVVPAGRTISVSAPVAGLLAAPAQGPAAAIATPARKGQALLRLTPLLPPERDLRIEAEKEIASAEPRVAAARSRLQRAEQVLRDKAGSVRSVEEARTELAQAEAALKAAQSRWNRLRTTPLQAEDVLVIESPLDGTILKVHAGPGQTVAAGAALFEVASLDPLWVRVPVYVGDLASVDRRGPASIHDLNAPGSRPGRPARPVPAPPSADPDAAAVDLYFELPNAAAEYRPGQRVGATLALRDQEQGLVVPRSAIVYDFRGGAWVYENPQPQVFVRRQVQIRRIAEPFAVLERGPAPGTKVVTAGAAELFGTEFGAGK